MTLILAMSQPEGIYICVDYRVTNSRTGAIIDDAATKHLTIHYPPVDGGPAALIAYTGLAILPDGTKMGSWIRETLRGENEGFDASMQHLKDRLNRDVAHLKCALIVDILVTHEERRYFGEISNVRLTQSGLFEVQRNFEYEMQELAEPCVFANGSGATVKTAGANLGRLQCQLGKHPNRATDYMKLLSVVNRDIARADPSVSPYCHVAFIPSPGYKFEPTGRSYTEPGESVPFDLPMIVLGIDLSASMRRAMQRFEDTRAGRTTSIEEPDPGEVDEELRRRP